MLNIFPSYSFNPEENELKIKIHAGIVVMALSFPLVILALLDHLRNDAMYLVYYSFLYLAVLSIGIFLLYRDKKYYKLVVRFVVLNAMIVLFLAILYSELLTNTFSASLLVIVAISMFIEVKERNYWYTAFLLSIFIGYFIIKPDYPMADIILFEIIATSIIVSLNIFEKIVISHKSDLLELANKERISLLGNMINMLGHQWRQPLSVITTVAGSIKLKDALKVENNEKDKQLDTIIATAVSLSNTLTTFRDLFSDLDKKSEVNLETLISDVLQPFKEKDLAVEIVVDKNLCQECFIYVSGSEMIKALEYIIDNAYDQFEIKDIQAKLIITLVKSDKEISIIIFNSGSSINEDDMAELFDPYFSTKRERNRVGLGLFMAKTLVERNNGNITLLNKDAGVECTVSFMS